MSEGDEELTGDVCIVGAGIAGLNALFVASRYLRPNQRVVLVDRNDKVGGMWVNTYDYVRLHQPHPFFTTGNIPWTLAEPPSHLAGKTEVLAHFQHCLSEIRKRIEVVELLGHEVDAVEELDDVVRVTCRGHDGRAVTVTAAKVIDAFGLDVRTKDPLSCSSLGVRSVSPDFCDMRTGQIAQDDAPVWIVGSGKTAMDSAYALIESQPGRSVNLVAGTGTFFISRDQFYPTGLRRWWSGIRPNTLTTELANRFDGTNEDEVMEWCRQQAGLSVLPTSSRCFLGIISEAEVDTIRDGLDQVRLDHLVDVVDGAGGEVQLRLRSGETLDVAPGSWIVNCTGYLNHREDYEHRPYLSPGGRIVTVGPSVMFGFSSFAGYFLSQLLFLDKISSVPLYEVDGNALAALSQPALIVTALTLAQYNLGLVFDNVPAKVFREFGLDFDRWYPLPRRLAGQIGFIARHKREREHHRRALDTVGERFGVRCGPVAQSL